MTSQTKKKKKVAEFNPNILCFCCNWCSYAGADLAGVSRFQYPSTIRIVRVMCSGRVDPAFILEGFKEGWGSTKTREGTKVFISFWKIL